MKAKYKQLLDKSLAAALAAIEVYNKPTIAYREESSVILLINAWELLLKAKILKDNRNKLSSLYVLQGKRKWKKTRTGNPLTLDIGAAMQRLTLDPIVIENLVSLMEIRDTAVHFVNADSLPYVVFTLAVAALKNYQHLCKQWFSHSLADYHFFIMPLSFTHDFRTFSSLDVRKSPPVVANLLKAVSEAQGRVGVSDTYYFACEIGATLTSAKKFAQAADLNVRIDSQASEEPVVITQTKRKLDQYPLSFTEVVEKIKDKIPTVRQKDINDAMKTLGIKNRKQYAEYSFRTKAQEERYKRSGKLPAGITSIYNEDAVRILVTTLEKTSAITRRE
jgi:hypothetical protein